MSLLEDVSHIQELLPDVNPIDDSTERPTATLEEQVSQTPPLYVVPATIVVDGETRLAGVIYDEKEERGIYTDLATRMVQLPGLDHLIDASFVNPETTPHDPDEGSDQHGRFFNSSSMRAYRPTEYPMKNLKFAGRIAEGARKAAEAEEEKRTKEAGESASR